NDLTAGASRQSGQDGRTGRIREEARRTVAEQEVAPTRVQAPEMTGVAVISQVARLEVKGADAFARDVSVRPAAGTAGRLRLIGGPEIHVKVVQAPPTEKEIGGRRAFAHHDRGATPIADVSKARPGAIANDAQPVVRVHTRNRQVTRQAMTLTRKM